MRIWPPKRLLKALLLLPLGGLLSCSGAHEPAQVPVAPAPAHAGAAATTNVPNLLRLSIDGLHSRLGAPQPLPGDYRQLTSLTGEEGATSMADSLASFRTGGLTIVASYDARTRRVRDILLLGRYEDSLMNRASLSANASQYLVMPVFRSDQPGRFMGLRVVSIN